MLITVAFLASWVRKHLGVANAITVKVSVQVVADAVAICVERAFDGVGNAITIRVGVIDITDAITVAVGWVSSERSSGSGLRRDCWAARAQLGRPLPSRAIDALWQRGGGPAHRRGGSVP